MKIQLFSSLFLVSVFAMSLTMSSVNAELKKEEIQSPIFIDRSHLYILSWLERRRPFLDIAPEFKRDFIREIAPSVNVEPFKLGKIVDILDEINLEGIDAFGHPHACRPIGLPYTWCVCGKMRADLRYIIILMQVRDILQKYPPETTPQIVHTSLAEGGLLQTYCLAYTLSRLGYRDIRINVIGDEILQIVAGSISKAEYRYPQKITARQKQIAKDAIERGFGEAAGVTVTVYKSAYDYIARVREERTPRSMSFDMIDSLERSKEVIYSTTPIPESFADNKGVLFDENPVCNTQEELGAVAQYERVSIWVGRYLFQKKAWERAYCCRNLEICNKAEYCSVEDFLDFSYPMTKINVMDVFELIRGQPLLAAIIEAGSDMERLRLCVLLLFTPKVNGEIFKTLINETCVRGQEPIAFEANNNRIYVYKDEERVLWQID